MMKTRTMPGRRVRSLLVLSLLTIGAVSASVARNPFQMSATLSQQVINTGGMADQLGQITGMLDQAKAILEVAQKQQLPHMCAQGLNLADSGVAFERLGLPKDCMVIMSLLRGDLKNLTLGELNKATPKEFMEITRAIAANRKVYQSVGSLAADIEQRRSEANLLNLSWPQYVTQEAQRIQQGNARAKERIVREQALLQAVEQDYTLAQKWAAALPTTVGVHQQMSILNVQMNRVLQQGARINQILAQAQGEDKALEEADKTTAYQRAMVNNNQFNSRNEARDREVRQGIDGISSGGRGDWMNHSNYKRQ